MAKHKHHLPSDGNDPVFHPGEKSHHGSGKGTITSVVGSVFDSAPMVKGDVQLERLHESSHKGKKG